MLARGLVVATQGNVSARDGDRFWITPSAAPYDAMTEADVVVLALDGTRIAGDRPPSREWAVHAAIYRSRPDVGAVVHTHSAHATAWSFLGEELALATEDLPDAIATAPFAPAGSQELATAATQALSGRPAVLMARHGVVGVGASPDRALDVCSLVERVAEMAWLLRGGP